MVMKNTGTQTADEIIRQLPTGLIRWYPFPEGKEILYVGNEDCIFEMLEEKYEGKVRCVPLSDFLKDIGTDKIDYIICIGCAEKLKDIQPFLDAAAKHLTPDGRLLLGVNNRLGLRYFCGDKDPHTGQVMDGIEDYSRVYAKAQDEFRGRSYDKAFLKRRIGEAGFSKIKFYTVISDLADPVMMIADGYTPNESLNNRIFPVYNDPDSLFLEEERLYKGLWENDMFHTMANAFLIECGMEGILSDALQITTSLDRGKENAVITVIHDNGTVTKEAGFKEGQVKLKTLEDNARKLKDHGVDVVDARIENGIYTMPYIDAPTGQLYLEGLLKKDKEAFLNKMDEFRQILFSSSETYEGFYKETPPGNETEKQKKNRLKREKEEWGEQKVLLLKEGMIDMVPLNSLYVDDHFVFLDQEFRINDLPADVLVSRMIFTFFYGNAEMSKLMNPGVLYERYGLPDPAKTPGGSKYLNIEFRFFDGIMNRDALSEYYKEKRRNAENLFANRQRMNYSNERYQQLFVDIFDKADERKLILFGSGVYAARFLALYADDYPVFAVIDNNRDKWGSKLYPSGSEAGSNKEGITISSPEILNDLKHGEYKILICIKNYLSVMNQLDGEGISEYSIFDPSKAYRRRRRPISEDSLESLRNSTVPAGGKKYHTGYIAGVFDLYHIGHLNMFRRAKEMCDYLIVGVVSDEGVRNFKGVEPFVPFNERVEMIRSCRYVDEVVEIPYIYSGSEDAFRLHHFDVQFSGSDYVNNPDFERFKQFLEENGATLEFFPYTESTSSTKLKELIEKKLL